MKFVAPIYQALNLMNSAEAFRIYNGHRDFYHPIAVDRIDKILGIKGASEKPLPNSKYLKASV